MLVAPILTRVNPDEADADGLGIVDFEIATTQRQVYLPEGTWYPVWNDIGDTRPVIGFRTITAESSFGYSPAYHLNTGYTALNDL